jgi:hypothetical protein
MHYRRILQRFPARALAVNDEWKLKLANKTLRQKTLRQVPSRMQISPATDAEHIERILIAEGQRVIAQEIDNAGPQVLLAPGVDVHYEDAAIEVRGVGLQTEIAPRKSGDSSGPGHRSISHSCNEITTY